MGRWGRFMNVPVCHGVGGSFDVMAGLTRRAPRWMQRCGLEWFYRFLQEPRRLWKRYLVTNLLFVGLVVRDLAQRYLGWPAHTAAADSLSHNGDGPHHIA